jgi:hypothetical protein
MTGFNVAARVRRDRCVSGNIKHLELLKRLLEQEAQGLPSLSTGLAGLSFPCLKV